MDPGSSTCHACRPLSGHPEVPSTPLPRHRMRPDAAAHSGEHALAVPGPCRALLCTTPSDMHVRLTCQPELQQGVAAPRRQGKPGSGAAGLNEAHSLPAHTRRRARTRESPGQGDLLWSDP